MAFGSYNARMSTWTHEYMEAIEHLRDEIGKLAVLPAGWQSAEVATNIFLLASGLLNCADEHLPVREVHRCENGART